MHNENNLQANEGLTAGSIVLYYHSKEGEAFFIVFKNMKNLFSESLSKKRVAIAFTSFIVFAMSSGVLAYQGSLKTVAFTVNGKKEVVKTHADTIGQLLNEQNLSLHSKDYLFPKTDTKVMNNMKIVFNEARQVQIVKDNEKKTVWTTSNTVAGLLKEQNIVLNDYTQITPGPRNPIQNNMTVDIKEVKRVTLVDGGHPQQVWSTSATVADLLSQKGIKLNQLDRVEPPMNENIKGNDTISVIRVEKVTDVVEEPVQFAVVTQNDANLANGIQKTVAEGVQGINSVRYEVVLENGKEVSRKVISENVVKSKQNKVVAVGTKDLGLQIPNAGNGRDIYVNATAYTANCGGCSGHTSTGINLYANPNAKIIAVDPSVIPLGTKVYVEGYGYAVAADTGGAIKGNRIDVFFSSIAGAFRWGCKKVKVTILY